MRPIDGRRIVFTGPGEVRIEEYSVEAPGPHQLLVETRHSLVSAGTEMSNLVDALGRAGYPHYPGYSNVGVVIAAGERVRGRYPPGTAVLSMGRHCSHVLLDLSPDREAGPEYVQPLDEGTDLRQATFAILGSVALHAIRRAEPQIGHAAAVFGQGVVGQLIVQLARAVGCRPVIALDLVESRLEKSRRSGASASVDASKCDPVEAIREIMGGAGADLLFDATRTPQTLPLMLTAAAPGGRVLIVGSLPGTTQIDLFTHFQLKELTLVGVFQPAAPTEPHPYNPWTQRRNRQEFLRLLADGTLQLGHLITHTPNWREAPQVFEMIWRGPGDWMAIVFRWG